MQVGPSDDHLGDRETEYSPSIAVLTVKYFGAVLRRRQVV